jgi:hypothetical protein
VGAGTVSGVRRPEHALNTIVAVYASASEQMPSMDTVLSLAATLVRYGMGAEPAVTVCMRKRDSSATGNTKTPVKPPQDLARGKYFDWMLNSFLTTSRSWHRPLPSVAVLCCLTLKLLLRNQFSASDRPGESESAECISSNC